MSDGILFANPVDAINFDAAILAQVIAWRPTFGGKLVAVFRPYHDVTTSARRWEWPIVPLDNADLWMDGTDVWSTGTALDLIIERGASKLVVPEVNRRKPRKITGLDEMGKRVAVIVERISKKIDHRVVWADRHNGSLVTDPLYKTTFPSLEEALAFLEEHAKFAHKRQLQLGA